MQETSSERNPIEVLAEEFLERYRRGERPPLTEYTSQRPDLADEICDLFPALLVMEGIRPRSEDCAGGDGGEPYVQRSKHLERLGDYRILREVGRGGMGVVYEAEQESLGRHVALKVLPPQALLNPQLLSRFQREARAAARLHHTNIVPVFGVGEDQGILYYAMQFIQGQALDAVLDDINKMRGPSEPRDPANESTRFFDSGAAAHSLLTGHFAAVEPPPADPAATPIPAKADTVVSDGGSQAHSGLSSQPEWTYYRSIARLAAQAAEGLAHAHAQGVLHRDIKPSNLLLDAQGTLWITDFGLAKAEGSDDLTHTGEFVGTLRYMAPERFEGRGDARSDIYALGVTLYEMLTLRPPFVGQDRVALMGQITNDAPPPPSKLAPHLPRDLETIVQKAMAREPAARYATARDLAEDLRRFLENRPIKARRSSAVDRLRRWCRRNPLVASLVGTVFLLLCCLTAGSVAVAIRLSQQRQALADAEVDRTEKFYQMYQARVAQAYVSRFSQRAGQRLGTLDAIGQAAKLVRERQMPAERLDELRNLAIAALALPDLRTLRTWKKPALGSNEWDTDSRMKRFACWQPADGIVSIRRLDTDQQMARIKARGRVRFGPSGRFLVTQADDRVRVWDLSGSEPRAVVEDEGVGFAFHPDGRHFVAGRRDGSVWLYDLPSPAHKASLLSTLQPAASGFAFDPLGNSLAATGPGPAQILDARSGQRIATIPDSGGGDTDAWHPSPAWHPSGRYLALIALKPVPQIHIWGVRHLRKIATLRGCRSSGIRVVFTPDGDRLLSAGWEGVVRLWDWRTGRSQLQQLANTPLTLSATGQLVIEEPDHFSLVAVVSAREYRSFVPEADAGPAVSFGQPIVHPQGRLLAVNMGKQVGLFDLETGDELAVVSEVRWNIAFQADGALLTNGDHGLMRWPIHQNSPQQWTVGPSELLFPFSYVDLASDRNGNVIGQANGGGATLVKPGKALVFLGPHGAAQHIGIGPDGQYVTTGINDGEEGVKLWETATGRLLRTFPMGRHCGGDFSPDGRWLAVHGSQGSQLVQVGTWKTLFTGHWRRLAFSPDGALFATEPRQGLILLMEPATGHEIARLEDPNQSSGELTFAPDGTRLIASSDVDRTIHVWDLRAMRTQLTALKLDWDAPLYAERQRAPPMPLQVNVDLPSDFHDLPSSVAIASLRLALSPLDGEAYFERGKAEGLRGGFEDAIADLTKALCLMPATHRKRAEALLRRSFAYAALGRMAQSDNDIESIADQDLAIPEGFELPAAARFNDVAWQRYLTG
ncbi:MAG TPA: serine/threonine-protein kinase, partial [Gemmataceae bacterium]|nr:serine/threonine-protein kinase [Gemmataceae bacterium]